MGENGSAGAGEDIRETAGGTMAGGTIGGRTTEGEAGVGGTIREDMAWGHDVAVAARQTSPTSSAPQDEWGGVSRDARVVRDQVLGGERALFRSSDVRIEGCVFQDGESPLKESCGVEVSGSVFRWKYPLWYCRHVQVRDSAFLEMARSGLWYTDDVSLTGCTVEAPKEFRRCRGVRVYDTTFANAQETLWTCTDVILDHVSARGDYFGKDSRDVTARSFTLVGNYCFDGGRDITVEGARLLSKDTFWNCENVTVRDSFITGEYLGWNSRNLTFENCTIESLQGLCYIDGLTLRNCRLVNTTLAFEYCRGLDVDVSTTISSVKNPWSGTVRAAGIVEEIFDDPQVDRSATKIATTGE